MTAITSDYNRNTECAICSEPFEKESSTSSENENTACLEVVCGHIFHEKCLTPWLDLNSSCPTCRAKTFKYISFDEIIEKIAQKRIEKIRQAVRSLASYTSKLGKIVLVLATANYFCPRHGLNSERKYTPLLKNQGTQFDYDYSKELFLVSLGMAITVGFNCAHFILKDYNKCKKIQSSTPKKIQYTVKT